MQRHYMQTFYGRFIEIQSNLARNRPPWKHLPHEPDNGIKNYKLKLHSPIKHLAIVIDKVFSCNKQINHICPKLARANGILSKSHHFIPKELAY